MKVLVTGATGRLGPHVVRAAGERGAHVRALTRDTARARTVLGDDVPLLHGDAASLTEASLAAVDTVVLLTPHGPNMAEIQRGVVDVAAATGTRVVKISGTSTGIRPDGPDACRQHWQIEEHLKDSGLPFVVVRPNGFMQTLLAGLAGTVREQGVVVNPLGSAGISLIDCADAGAATAAAVCDNTHDGANLVLTGPSAPTYADMAEQVGRGLGVDVPVVDVTPEAAAQAAQRKGLSAWEAEHLAEMLTLFASGASEYVTDDVERLTGRPPTSTGDWIARNAALFRS